MISVNASPREKRFWLSLALVVGYNLFPLKLNIFMFGFVFKEKNVS